MAHRFCDRCGDAPLRRSSQPVRLGWQKPTLIVVDYAGALLKPIWSWLHELADHPIRKDGPPLRLLLLEREADLQTGWLRSLRDASSSASGVQCLFDPLEPMRLAALGENARHHQQG